MLGRGGGDPRSPGALQGSGSAMSPRGPQAHVPDCKLRLDFILIFCKARGEAVGHGIRLRLCCRTWWLHPLAPRDPLRKKETPKSLTPPPHLAMPPCLQLWWSGLRAEGVMLHGPGATGFCSHPAAVLQTSAPKSMGQSKETSRTHAGRNLEAPSRDSCRTWRRFTAI